MTRKIKPNFPVGTISHGSLRLPDLADAALAAIARLQDYGYAGRNESSSIRWELKRVVDGKDDGERATESLAEAEDFINAHCPEYLYYGAVEGDGSDIGFWVSWDGVSGDRGDGELPDVDKRPPRFTGLAVQVNDHGNTTLYYCSRGKVHRVVWAVV